MIVKGIVSAINADDKTASIILPEYDVVTRPIKAYREDIFTTLKVDDFVLVVIFNDDFNDCMILTQIDQEIDAPVIDSETVSAMTEVIFDPESIIESTGSFDGTDAAIVDFKAVIEVDGVETTITKDTAGLESFYIGGDYNHSDDGMECEYFDCRSFPFLLEPYDDYITQVFQIVYNGVEYYTWNLTIFLAKNYSKLATTKYVKEKVAFADKKADKDMRNVGADGAKYLSSIVFQTGTKREIDGWNSFDGTGLTLVDFKIVTTINGVETTITKDTDGVTDYQISGGFNGEYVRDINSLPYAISGTDCMVDGIYVTLNGKSYSNYDSVTTYFALVVKDINNTTDDKLVSKSEVLELIQNAINSLSV